MELADELAKQGCECETQVANDAAPVTQSEVQSEVLSLLANLKKARDEEAIAKVELDGLRAVSELATKEHNVLLAKDREERQDEVDEWKGMTSPSEATLAKVCDETSAEVEKLHSDQNRAAARHQ